MTLQAFDDHLVGGEEALCARLNTMAIGLMFPATLLARVDEVIPRQTRRFDE